MRDQDDRAAAHQPRDRVDDRRFRLGVDGARWLVEDEDRTVREECARDGDPLTLSSRKLDPTLADLRVVPVWKPDDELVGVRRLRRRDHLGPARAGSGVGDVFGDRRGEKHRILLDDGELPAEISDAEVAQIGPVEVDMSGGRVVEPGEEADESALARAGGAHDAEPRSRFDGERDVVQDGTLGTVREGDVVKGDGAARARDWPRV